MMDYTLGRNLLRNSGEFTSLSRWSANQNVSLSLENGEIKAVTNQSTSTPGIRYSYSEKIKLEPGTYTLSVVAKIVSEKDSRIPYPCYTYGTGANIPSTAQQTEELEDGYCKYSRTFEISAATTSMWLGILLSSPNIGDMIYLRSVKLEYGDEATPWRHAPEDAVDIISEGGVEFMILARESITVSRAIDISSYTRYYLLQASTLNPPAKPTSANPGGNWVTTEPSYTSGSTNSLYFVDKTTFSDGTFSYSNVSLSSEYEAAKEAYNLAHTANTNAGTAQETADQALAQSVEYIVGTQTAATGSWTGVTQDAELKTGKTIAYKLPYAGSGNASLTLTLATGTQTAAIPVYLNNTRVTTHYPAASVIKMTYDGGAWRTDNYDSNSNNYDRRLHNDNIKAATAITKNYIIVGTAAGYKNLAASVAFDLSYPILWASAAIAAAASAKTTYEAYPAVPFSTSGTIQSGAAAKMLYLKGTVSGNTFTVAASNYLTTVIPTSADGFYYIPLGVMTSATAGYFASSNRLFAYLNGSFQAVDTAAAGIAQTTQNDLVAHKNYFWHDSSGAHISDTAGSTAGKNVLINSDGMQIRNGSDTLAAFYSSAVDFLHKLRMSHSEDHVNNSEMEHFEAWIPSNSGAVTKWMRIGINNRLGSNLGDHSLPLLTFILDDDGTETTMTRAFLQADEISLYAANKVNVNSFPVVTEKITRKSISIGTNRYISLTRNGIWVELIIHYGGAIAAGGLALGNIIPEGFRPETRIFTSSSKLINNSGTQLTSSTECLLIIYSDGKVDMFCSAAADANWYYDTTISYITNDAWPTS